MRIITGSARGRRLKTQDGFDTRPTAESVKEGIFSAIQFDIEGKVIADLFAGSGQLGLEALSRGAKKAFFIDNNQESINIINSNVNTTGFSEKSAIHLIPVAAFIRTALPKSIDIAFLDPPYNHKYLEKTVLALVEKMSDIGIMVCEHERELELPLEIDRFKIKKVYRYGKTSVSIYRPADMEIEEDDVIENENKN